MNERLSRYWLPIVQATGDEEAFFNVSKHRATAQTVTEFLVFQHGEPQLHRVRPSARRAKTPGWCATRSRSSRGRN